MDVSVILCTYNHERWIAQAIDSVLDQATTARVELIISEDHSTDRTRDIVRTYAQQHPHRIRLLLSERNLRSPEVLVRALRAARGEFVAYLDGDDHWLPGKLEEQVAFMRAHPACPMSFHTVEVEGGEPGEQRRFDRPWLTLESLLRENPVPAPSLMYRRAALDLPDWFGTLPYLDWPLGLLLLERGDGGYFDRSLALYRRHDRGMWSGSTSHDQAAWDVAILERMHAHVPAHQRRHTAVALARARFRLAESWDRQGERRKAVTEVGRSMRLAPSSPELTAGRRARFLVRLAAPRTYGRIREVARRSDPAKVR